MHAKLVRNTLESVGDMGACVCMDGWLTWVYMYIAAIYFKNRMNKAWDRSREVANPINEDDRNMVKQSILQALLRAPSAVQ